MHALDLFNVQPGCPGDSVCLIHKCIAERRCRCRSIGDHRRRILLMHAHESSIYSIYICKEHQVTHAPLPGLYRMNENTYIYIYVHIYIYYNIYPSRFVHMGRHVFIYIYINMMSTKKLVVEPSAHQAWAMQASPSWLSPWDAQQPWKGNGSWAAACISM